MMKQIINFTRKDAKILAKASLKKAKKDPSLAQHLLVSGAFLSKFFKSHYGIDTSDLDGSRYFDYVQRENNKLLAGIACAMIAKKYFSKK